MRKVIITCPCGQRMQVSRSAYGKIGICPKCNQKLRVGANGPEPLALPSPGDASSPPPQRDPFKLREPADTVFERAKRDFARAVDSFYHGQYDKALAILEALQSDLPDNAQIRTARLRCAEALNAAKAEKPTAPVQAPPEAPATAPLPPEIKTERPAELTAEAVYKTVLHLMTSSSSDAIKLKAAELAARLLGIDRPAESVETPGMFFANLTPNNGKRKRVDAVEEPAGIFKHT